MKSLRYAILLRPEPEGGFTVFVPALPGCITYGRNLAVAQKMAKDAIQGYLWSMKKHGEAIPSDTENFLTSVEIKESSRSRTPAYA